MEKNSELDHRELFGLNYIVPKISDLVTMSPKDIDKIRIKNRKLIMKEIRLVDTEH